VDPGMVLPVSNGLISEEYFDYLNSYKHRVNPESNALKVAYGGMGPDFITVSLATNATEIWGIDVNPYNASKVKFYLENWKSVDTYDPRLPPTERINDRDYFRMVGIDPVARPEYVWERDVGKRKSLGYWDLNAISTWGVERLLVYEFKKSGVEENSVTVEAINPQKTEVSFDWAYPGEKNRRRTLKLIHDDFYGAISGDTKNVYPRFDVVYVKSVPSAVVSVDWFSRHVPILIKDGGYFFIGGTIGEKADIAKYESNMSIPHFLQINYDRERHAQMLRFTKKADTDTQGRRFDYGWRLYLFRYVP
jgi:hypothetical protein